MTVTTTAKVPAAIKEKINDLSLMLVMTSDNDETGITLLCEILDGIAPLVTAECPCSELIVAWEETRNKRTDSSQAAFFTLLQTLITTAIAYCERPNEITFPSLSNTSSLPTKETVDLDFLPEFIENHRMQLEEFESWLMDSEFKNQDGEDVTALVKRYVHSLKGDAGSIGLTGLEQSCHFVEDYIGQSGAKTITSPLLQFKEWVSTYLESLTKGESPKESAIDFKARFKTLCTDIAVGAEVAPLRTSTSTSSPNIPNKIAASAAEVEYLLTGEKDIFQEFVAEAEEHLGNVESIILESECSYSKDAIDTIFRGIHSLKGGSAYFTFKEMTETSHILENLLDEVRSGKRELTEALSALVLTYIDLQKNLLSNAKIALTGDGKIKRLPASAQFLQELADFIHCVPRSTTSTPTENSAIQPTSALEAAPLISVAPIESESSTKGEKLEVKNFVKVDTVRLDHLIDSIGEMVIYSSMLIRRCRELLPEKEDVQSITHRVEKFTRDLQDVGMSMRLVPIKGLFQKMSRLVWDTSKKIHKDIEFSMDGEDTELDRNLIDKLADPLMHMVRNALDHGVEPPDERIKAGKARSGKVHLSATQSGGSIVIRITDDGRGLNPEKLLAKAREKKIIEQTQVLSEQETYQLIFAAGFSTAATVTDISGRGVGMDVVRRNVESLRGRIHIESKVGAGTTFSIELPLTLAIVDGIELAVGEDRLIVPSLAIVEFVKPVSTMLNYTLDQGETFFFRGKYLPIFRLSDLYNITPKYTNPLEATIIVVENHEEYVALMVDEIIGELSTVIKSLGPMFGEVKGVSGCAVMPNGDVALILDIRSLVNHARVNYKRQIIESTTSPMVMQ